MIGLLVSVLMQASQPAARPQFDQVAAQAASAHKEGRESDALQLYREAVKIRPSWADGWWNIGTISYERQDFAAARDAMRKLVTLDPKAVAAFAILGLSEYQLHDYNAALQHLDTARSLGLPHDHPLGDAALFYMALLLNRQGQYDAAAGLLLSTPEKKVSSPAVQVAIGMTGLRIAKLPEELTPSEREMALYVGRAMAAPEADATVMMRELLAAHPDQANLHYLYGMVLLHGDSDAAVAQFHKELEHDPHHLPSLLAIVREMERESKYQEALIYAQQAVQAGPDNFAAHAILGRVLVALNRATEGVRELELARDLEPGSPQIYYALAAAYTKLGRPGDAEKARAEFLRLKNFGSGKPEE